MKMSTRARYGVRLMFELGLCYGGKPMFLKDIARNEELSEKYLSQLVMPLKASGLVNSVRGAQGGYLLARPPEQITVKDIVEILEGDLAPSDCSKDNSLCARSSYCITRGVWEKLEKSISKTLKSITLNDLVSKFKKEKINRGGK